MHTQQLVVTTYSYSTRECSKSLSKYYVGKYTNALLPMGFSEIVKINGQFTVKHNKEYMSGTIVYAILNIIRLLFTILSYVHTSTFILLEIFSRILNPEPGFWNL